MSTLSRWMCASAMPMAATKFWAISHRGFSIDLLISSPSFSLPLLLHSWLELRYCRKEWKLLFGSSNVNQFREGFGCRLFFCCGTSYCKHIKILIQQNLRRTFSRRFLFFFHNMEHVLQIILTKCPFMCQFLFQMFGLILTISQTPIRGLAAKNLGCYFLGCICYLTNLWIRAGKYFILA